MRRKACGPLLVGCILIVLIAPSSAHAITIMNSATVTPPCTDNIWITWTTSFALYISLPTDNGSAVARCNRPLDGTAKPYARSYITSWWPSGAKLAFARTNAESGFSGFTPGRYSQFIADFDVLFSGQAALYVPQAATWLGGADAMLDVRVVVRISEMEPLTGLPVVTWEWQHPIIDNVRTHHGTPSWVWNEPRTFSSGPIGLEPGRVYAARIGLYTYTEANTIGSSGGGTAWVNFENPDLAAGFVVNSVTFRDATPDDTGPSVDLAEGSLTPGIHCFPIGTFPKVIVTADDGDGYGVESIRYRVDEGPEQVYNPAPDIPLGPGDHTVEFWAIDKVGNPGDHMAIDCRILWTAASPALVGLPDGSSAVRQPVVLEWDPVAEASEYHLQIDDDPAFASPEVDMNVSEVQASLQGLPVSTVLHWRVQSLNQCGAGPWSAAWSFTTDVTTAVGDELPERVPARYVLDQNHPNPFNPSTTISFGIPVEDRVALRIYTPSGQLVRTLFEGPVGIGFHDFPWNGLDEAGRSVASGVYLYRLQATGFDRTRKMTLVR